MTRVVTASVTLTRPEVLKRIVAVVAGTLLVALSAQVAIPVPGTPVPVTLQVAAVLIVGGLIGPRLGAASLALYLLLGASGLPVFAPGGLPGAARLLGPTGGFLLAYPVAAAIAGLSADDPARRVRLASGMVLAAVVIHLGGVAQLAILGGGLARAFLLGSVPFLVADLLKVAFAGLVVWRFASATRALR